MKLRASINDVAKKAGVSIMSVSRAIRGVEGVSTSTRAHVLAIAEELGYQPNFNARSLAVSKARLIGVSLPTLFDEVFADILEGMRGVLERSGFDLIVETSNYDLDTEMAWVERIAKWSPAGLVLTGTNHLPDLRKRISQQAIPVVEIWDDTADPIDISVGIDHYQSGRLAARHMLDCGYDRPCLVGITQNMDPRAEKRFEGFMDEFSGHGAVSIRRTASKPSFEAGHETVHAIWKDDGPRCDSLFFLNDHLAFGGLCALSALKVSVPGDVGIVGFNNLGINKVLERRLTTIETPRRLLGQTAGQRLLSRIHGAVTETVTRLPAKLVPGDTTRVPAGLPPSAMENEL